MTDPNFENNDQYATQYRNYFDIQYSMAESYWGDQPNLMVPLISSYLRPGSRLLIVGCGEGRDAIFLARLGFGIVATEISKNGIARARKAASEKKVEIETHLLDAQSPHDHLGEFDAVLMMNVIQYLNPELISCTIDHFKSLIRHEGIFCAQLFTVEDPAYKTLIAADKTAKGRLTIKDPRKGFNVRYFEKGELASHFSSWELIHYHEGLIWDKPHGNQSDFHQHGIAQMVARKKN